MFNPLIPQPNSNHVPLSGAGTIKLYAAVNALRTAFNDILDSNNYLNVDINDPYINFALSLYSKYNNDLDFQNSMTFPIQLPSGLSTLHSYHNLVLPQSQQPISNNNPTLVNTKTPYIYTETTPFLFSIFPSFPYLPLNSFTSTLLNDETELERLCFIGSTIFEYLIKITLIKKDSNMLPKNVIHTVSSIININSLSILCQAYNIEINYKFIGSSIPRYKLFLAYLGKYYDDNITDKHSIEEFSTLFKWTEELLGYINDNQHNEINKNDSETVEKETLKKESKANIINSETTPPEDTIDNDSVLYHLGHKKTKTDNGFKLQELIQSVQQDLNQNICSSKELSYKVDEHPDLQTGMFSCSLSIDGVEVSSATAMNKKLAKSGAALLAAIDQSMIKNIKRSCHDYWMKKYINKENLIRKGFVLDSRFDYYDINALSLSDSKSEDTSGDSEEKSVLSQPVAIPIPYNPSSDKEKINGILLSTAKEKLYAYYNSKLGIVPKYEYRQLGNSVFEAKLYIEDELVSKAIGRSKKEAGARAAVEVLEKIAV